jgi:2-iminobutanoate/2-iminopropanoate deaminase
MELESLTGGDMPPALGPYAQAVRAGDLLFVSGQPGLDPDTGDVPPGGFEAEAAMAFRNLRTVLEAAGSGLDRVVKVTVYLASAEDFVGMNQLYGEAFPTSPPARATPIVGLPRGLRISIEAIAVA